MPINTPHPLYSDHNIKVTRCRDTVEGTDAIKAKGEIYLPKLGGQVNSEYLAYKNRALFTNVTSRSLSGYVGIITSKPAELTYPKEMQIYFDDATLTNTSFNELLKFVVEDVFISGRVPLLVDKPVSDGRAYIVRYKSEDLLNWAADSIGNLMIGSLQETKFVPKDNDPFDLEELDTYRGLFLVDGQYVVKRYQQNKVKSVDEIETFTPNVKGVPLSFIPLTIITPQGLSLDLYKPPILDIVDVNLSHYRTSADLEQGRHWVSLPTPVVSGIDVDSVLRVGSQTAWVLPDKDAKAYYLEFQGQGLQSLEKAMAEKHSQMTLFSAQLMNTSTRGSESSDVIKLRFASDAATLSSIATAIEVGLNNVYKTLALWEGFDPNEVNIKLDKEFINTALSAAEIQAFTKSFIDGAIDEETYLFNLKRGGLVPSSKESLDTNIDRGNENA